METIDSLRQEVDQVHKELYSLLLRRRELTLAIWKLKVEQGLPFYNREREEAILQSFLALSPHSEDPEFREVLKGVMTSILQEYQKYLLASFSSLS